MKTMGKNSGWTIPAALLLAWGVSACGGVAIPNSPVDNDGIDSDGGYLSGDTDEDGSDGGSSEDEDDQAADSTQAYTWTVKMDGHDDVEVLNEIYTDDLLEIEVTGLSASAVSGSGYSAVYSCVRVQVEVEGETQTAFVTNTGADGTGVCAGAVARQTLDFSHRMSSGHGEVEITITDAEYDNCRLYGFLSLSGCPMSSVYSSSYGKHTVGLNFTVNVNGL
jgi:hypothetical protein